MVPPPPPPPPPPPNARGYGSRGYANGQENHAFPPPPPPPRPSQSSSNSVMQRQTFASPPAYEPYGKVDISSSSYSNVSRRTPVAEQTRRSSYVLPPTSPAEDTTLRSAPKQKSTSRYVHNTATLSFLIPSLASILWWHDSVVVVQAFLCVCLILYALDLVNSRDGIAVGVWLGALVMTIASGCGTLLQMDDMGTAPISMLNFLLQLAVEGTLFLAWACWMTLQFRWLYTDLPSMAMGMELTLHSLVPPVCSAILTNQSVRLLTDYWGMDRVATFAPLAFALFMAMAMVGTGSTQSLLKQSTSTHDAPKFIITPFTAQMQTMVLLLVPGMMHVLIFRGRILSRFASFDEIYDLVIVWTLPYLLQCLILGLFEKSPYSLPKLLFPKANGRTLIGTFVPIAATFAASFALQQRYLIPLCNQVSYQFNGHEIASPWVVTFYLTSSTLTGLFAILIWGKTSSVTNELFFGEYHEDVVQLSISMSGMLLGKAFGFPWNLTPLPILAFLGLSVWLTTKMMRYLLIYLFVIHAAGFVLFGYRFASIAITVPLAIPGIELGLVRFGMAEIIASVLIGLVIGFVARPSGGLGASIMKRVDVPGMVLVLYSILLTVLEVTLLRRPLPESLPKREVDSDVEDSDFVYDHASALITSCLLVGIASCARRIQTIGKPTYIAAIAIAVGKAVAVFIDASEADSKIRSERTEEKVTHRLLYRALVTSALIFVMLIPSAVLQPLHMKSGSRMSKASGEGKPLSSISSNAKRNIFIYCLGILPITLVASVSSVLSPLVMALSSHYNLGAYYNMALPMSETIGCALSLWGVSSLYMLNHYLPDGGGESWKKSSALTLLMGAGIAFSAPTVPEWLAGENDLGISNPYAGISSLGIRLVTQGHNRTGGWGILSASLATLLAIIGPFELRERRHPSGRKDKTLFLRLMMFSIMFGCGLSWFITILSMSQDDFFSLAITTLACMVLSFFGTATSVLGYYIELENFNEVVEMFKLSMGVFFVFLFITCLPSLLMSSSTTSATLLSSGGSLSTYLTVASCVTLSLALAVRLRSSKNQSSKSIGNLSCIVCYAFAVINLFGRLGVAGLDAELGVTVFMGMPASLFGTLCIAPILLVLEGASTKENRSRISRVSGGTPTPSKVFGITMKNLNASNHFVPPIAATIFVFYLVGIYTLFLRGSPFMGPKGFEAGSGERLSSLAGRNKDFLVAMAEKVSSSSRAYSISSSLQGSGFWTSTSTLQPLLHVAGFVATIPSAYLLLSQLWYRVKRSRGQIFFALPFNIFPLIVCQGTPSIRAISVILLFGGFLQLLASRQNNRSHMRL